MNENRNPLLIGRAEEIDRLQPQVRAMLDNPGFYIGGDTSAPEYNVPLVSKDGQVFSMVLDTALDPERFLPTLRLIGPFRIDQQPEVVDWPARKVRITLEHPTLGDGLFCRLVARALTQVIANDGREQHGDHWTTSDGVRVSFEVLERDVLDESALSGGLPADIAPPAVPEDEQLPAGITGILAERRRQIDVEGFDATNDDAYRGDDLVGSAMAYVWNHWFTASEPENPPMCWPWGEAGWNPKDRKRDLERAGALIAAELARMDRAEAMARAETSNT